MSGRKGHSLPRQFVNLVETLEFIDGIETIGLGRWTKHRKNCSRLEIKFYDQPTNTFKVNCYGDGYILSLAIHLEKGYDRELVEKAIREYRFK